MSLKDQAYDRIKDLLFANDGAGQVYSERQLAATLGLNLAPVRSALERLRTEGLIIVVPNTGILLPDLTVHCIRDFYELRTVMEGHIVASIAGRLTVRQLEKIEKVVRQQEKCTEREDAAVYHELDLTFHLTLAELHGNEEMMRVLGQLRDRMHRLSTRLNRQHPERLRHLTMQHRKIVEALRAGDADGAKGCLQSHLRWGRDFVLESRTPP